MNKFEMGGFGTPKPKVDEPEETKPTTPQEETPKSGNNLNRIQKEAHEKLDAVTDGILTEILNPIRQEWIDKNRHRLGDTLTDAEVVEMDDYVDHIDVHRMRDIINAKIRGAESVMGDPQADIDDKGVARMLKQKLERLRMKLYYVGEEQTPLSEEKSIQQPDKDGLEEIPTEEKLDQLCNALDKRVIKNSDGADVTLHVTRERMTKTSEEIWYVTFEYEYNGRLINRRYPQTSNYISLSIVPETHEIKVVMAQLEAQVLKGKNVYPQVMQLLGESFPSDFALEAEFGHEATRETILDAKLGYEKGQIDIEQFKQRILQSHLFKARVAGGFNKFEILFSKKPGGDTNLKVSAKKDTSSHSPEITILGL